MGPNDKENSRTGFLEDASGSFRSDKEGSGRDENPEPATYYDFGGKYIDLPRVTQYTDDGKPVSLKTTGEIKYELMKRIAIILIRITIAIIFIMFFVRGTSCEYPGTIITCT